MAPPTASEVLTKADDACGRPLAADGDAACDEARAALLSAYRSVRAASLQLASVLSPEDAQVQSMDDTSPAKWHLGHVSWFFETFLLLPHADGGYDEFHPRFGYIFNSYYEGIGPRHARPRRGLLTSPPLEDVIRYRGHVDDNMAWLIKSLSPERWDRLAPVISLGLHHEQQHQELLLTDIKHAFGGQPMEPAYLPNATVREGNPAPLDFIPFPGGKHEIGHDGAGFAFDNETPRHAVWLEDYRLAGRCVTNGEYRAFMEDGGYREPTLWLSDGWAWVEAGCANMEGEAAPLYWRKRDGAWHEFTLGGTRPLDDNASVAHLTYYEADAYARWAGKRLPTEAEWEAAAQSVPLDEGDANLMASGCLHPMPAAGGAAGLAQMYGDVWEWTSSAYLPYPRFRPAPGAVGEYNGKFMCNQMVLKGGSCATPPGHTRATYRNFFYPHQNWQLTGLRLADDG